ncbi:ATP-dependent DNA helicase PIF1 [Linum perenne]
MPPKFAQMFVFDTANEIKHRMNSFPSDINDISEQIIKELKDMFDEHNVLVKVFRYARDRLNADGVENVKIKLTGNRSSDRREYDLPTIDELAILIVDETGEDTYHPDIVVQHISNEMERLSFFHPSLMALQYPILFPHGEDGWHSNIMLSNTNHPTNDSDVLIPSYIMVEQNDDPFADIVKAIYFDVHEKYANPTYFADRAILAPLHEIMSSINDHMLTEFLGEETCYYSSDTIQSDGEQLDMLEAEFPTQFLNSMKIGNFPSHELKLKVGAPIILLRNIDQSTGFCNGTRLIIKRLGSRSVEVEVLTGSHAGDRVYLPRIALSSHQKSLNFTLIRRQYPIALCFSMTINKSQGQTLQQVGICLKRQVFTHGQLYVAISRVTKKSGLKIISCDEGGHPTSVMKIISYFMLKFYS